VDGSVDLSGGEAALARRLALPTQDGADCLQPPTRAGIGVRAE
jgi:hypothetical protein